MMKYSQSRLIHNPLSFLRNIPFNVVLLAWLILAVGLSYLYFLVPVNPDSAVFEYIGWVMAEGGVAYVDAADQNWPGQMFIHALSAWLFGTEIWSYRAFEIIIIIPFSCFILFAFVDKACDRLHALLVVPSYHFIYIVAGYWSSGQRDMVAAPLLIAAAFFLYQRHTQGSIWNMVLQGIFIALATIIRPTLLVLAPLLFVADLLLMARSTRSFWQIITDHTVSTIAVLSVLGGLAVFGMTNGGFSAWYTVSVQFALEVYSQSVPIWQAIKSLIYYYFAYWNVFLLLSAIGGVILWKKNITAFMLVITLLPATLISALVQGKGLGYHLAAMLPLMVILLVVVLAAVVNILQTQQLPPIKWAMAIAILLLVIVGSAIKVRYTYSAQLLMLAGKIDRYGMYERYVATSNDLVNVKDVMQLAEYVEQSTAADETVLFWGRPCHVNTLSKRRSPFFAASFALLAEADPQFSAFSQWQHQLQSVMQEQPPELLLLVRAEEGGYMWVPEHEDNTTLAGVIYDNLSRYALETSFGRVDVLRLIKPR